MRQSATNTLLIQTPEGIVFSLPLAGPVTRFLAWSVDVVCMAALCVAAGSVLGLLGLVSFDFARAAMVFASFVIQTGYGIVMEWFWRGQTIGKRLLRLRVMDAQGLRLQFSQIVIRNLLRFIDMLPAFYLVGGIACLLSRRAQRLGDFAAKCGQELVHHLVFTASCPRSASWFRSRARMRESRDLTVPSGRSSAVAISESARSAHAWRSRTSRSSFRSSARAVASSRCRASASARSAAASSSAKTGSTPLRA